MHRLLLADDSVTIQRVIELTFADEDIEVIAVGDGREAIRRIESDRPDIVLADVGMPEKDGYEVAAFVKNTPHLRHIPVLLLTGAFEPVDEQRAQEVGCDGVLAKPFEPQMVITRVNELLREAPPPRAVAPPPEAAPRPVAPPPSAFAPPPRPVAPPPPYEAPEIPAPSGAAPPPGPAPAPHAAELVSTSEARPLSPLDAFLAAAPALDLDAYGSTDDDAVEPYEHVVSDAPASVEPISTPELSDLRSSRGEPRSPIEDVVAAPPEIPAADPSAVRISRRTPIAVPGFGAPALPPASTTAELDEYFEKLDAAFATLQQHPAKSAAPEAPATPAGPGSQSSHPTAPLHSPSRWVPPPAEPAPVAASVDPHASDHAPAIAQAFSALLAAEHGQALPPQPATAAGAPPLSPEVIDELVDRIANEVLERMSDRAVREAVTDIVSRIAERLVREEIDRVKATIK